MKKVGIYKAELLHPSETFIRDQASSYTEWSPVLFGLRRVPGLDLEGIDVRLLEEATVNPLSLLYRKLQRYLWRASRRAVRRVQAERPALMHVHFGTEAVDFWPIARALRVPLIVTLHGYDITVRPEYWESTQHGARTRLYPRRLIELSRDPRVHFIAVSHAIRQSAIDFGLESARLSTRYIGVDCERFAPAGLPIEQRARRILYVGRLVEKKGVKFLLQAFARVRAQVPDAELVIIGEGPLRAELQSLAEALRVPVTFSGSCASDEVRAALHETRVFCLPSITAPSGDAEGFGMVLLEAQACGVPVITSARGGATEGILDEVTGFAFAEGDVEELTARLIQLLTDDACALRMASAAPRFVRERFELHGCTRALEHFYDELLSLDRSALPLAITTRRQVSA